MLLIYKIKRILKQLWIKLVMNLQILRKTEAPVSMKQCANIQFLLHFLPGSIGFDGNLPHKTNNRELTLYSYQLFLCASLVLSGASGGFVFQSGS